jgi:hypothetical protein
MKFEKIHPGTIAYTVTRQKMGNTTVKTIAIHSVRVVSTDYDSRIVMASWNGNEVQRFSERQYSKWKASKPITITSPMGRKRLATREEIKALKAANPPSQN